MRRAAASISASAMSAVVSSSTSGVFPTGIPRAVAASRSTLSTPTAKFEIARRCGHASIWAASMRSASIVRRPSASRACSVSCS